MTDPAEHPQRLPWELHPALEEARLRAIARVVQNVCHDSAADHQPEKGETAWSLGCVRYDRLRFSVQAAAQGEHVAWLEMVPTRGLYMLLKIGGVPVRIYHGEEDETAPARYALPTVAELHAMQLALDGTQAPEEERAFRFIYDINGAGKLTEIWFAQVDEAGQVYDAWPIPLEPLAEELPFKKAPIVPPEIVIELRDESKQQQNPGA
jgi:pimeloyl-ACP methyl ester carboxylesterase